jgi:hypothetical protein
MRELSWKREDGTAEFEVPLRGSHVWLTSVDSGIACGIIDIPLPV